MLRESLTNKDYLRRLVWVWYNKCSDTLFVELFFPLIRLISLNFIYFLSTKDLQKIIQYRKENKDKKERKLVEKAIKNLQADELSYIMFEEFFD